MAKSTAQTSNDYRAKLRAKGLKKVELWVYPECEQHIRNHSQFLNEKHEKDKGEDNAKK